MKIIDIVIKFLQICALISIIVTCSIANWWMENDHIYQKFAYDRAWQDIEMTVSAHEAQVKAQNVKH